MGRKQAVPEDVLAGVRHGLGQGRVNLLETDQLERVIKNGATMGKRYSCMVVEAAEQYMAIESAESRQICGARATEGFRIKVQKVSLSDIGLHVIANAMYLNDGNRRGSELPLNRASSDIGGRVGLHHAFHDHLVLHLRILQQLSRSVTAMEHTHHIFEWVVSQAFVQVFWNTVIDVKNAYGRVRRVLAEQLGDE